MNIHAYIYNTQTRICTHTHIHIYIYTNMSIKTYKNRSYFLTISQRRGFLIALIEVSILYYISSCDLMLGVGLRFTDTTLNLIQSAVETSATLMLIIIRMFNAYIGYRRVHRSLRHVIHFDDHSPYCLERGNGASCKECSKGRGSEEVHIVSIRQWMIVQVLAGLILVSICIGCFFLFLNYLHLGWTILSNNFCMITITVLASLYAGRVTVAVTRIVEDLHKVGSA